MHVVIFQKISWVYNMRLWHQSLISKLPRAQILGLHREICALRGNGWGRKHKTVDYVFTYNPEYLIAFHFIVMREMKSRGYTADEHWLNSRYRGKNCKPYNDDDMSDLMGNLLVGDALYEGKMIFKEHNDDYLLECLDNLRAKGVEIE